MLIDYTNHAGQRRVREINPVTFWYGVTQWHSEPQWFLTAADLSSPNFPYKDFAVKDIHACNPRSIRLEAYLSIGCGPLTWDKPYLDVLGYKDDSRNNSTDSSTPVAGKDF